MREIVARSKMYAHHYMQHSIRAVNSNTIRDDLVHGLSDGEALIVLDYGQKILPMGHRLATERRECREGSIAGKRKQHSSAKRGCLTTSPTSSLESMESCTHTASAISCRRRIRYGGLNS